MPSDSVCLIDRHKIEIASQGKIYSLNLPETIVNDLEIIDKSALWKLVTDFLFKSKIFLGDVIVVLTEDVCFTSDTYKEGFISNLPFEDPISTVLGNKVIATNSNFYNAIVDILSASKGRITCVAPLFASPEMSTKNTLDIPVSRFVLSNESFYMKNSFSYNTKPSPKPKIEKTNKITPRTIALIGIFIVLAIILVIVIVLSSRH